ncbi:MAG: flagellar biosynthesis protein FlgA [Propionibacteriaceae bacterium]|nr:flagellar biosynthesis protein FlgA [Propionibacteriaceae bacterium]
MTATEIRVGAAQRELRPETDPGRGQVRVRRQPKWIAAGVLAICLGGLGAAVLWAEAAGSTEVLVMTRSVARGEVVETADVRIARVGQLDGVSRIDGDELHLIAGRTALVDLAEGALVPAGGVGEAALDGGGVQLGLRLDPGRIPLDQLPAGTPVLLVGLDDPRGAPDAPARPPRPFRGTVLTPPQTGPDGVARLLDVRVDAAEAAAVAELAATDRIVLVKEGQ